MVNKHSKKTTFKNVVKNFTNDEIDIANIIMDRMGSWDTRKAFGNDIKCLYLYAARNVFEHIEKRFELIPKY